MRQDEERAAIGAAEQQLDRTVGHVDAADGLAGPVVDEDLAIRHVHVAVGVARRAFPAAFREHLEIAERAVDLDRRAVRAVVDSARVTLDRAGLAASEVDWFIPHQANLRIIEAAANRLKIPMDRTVVNINRYGNTSAASIPLAIAEAVDDGKIADGDILLLSGFGAGMTWASAVLRWGRA